jgi:ribosomal protein L11 methyltransferase
MIRLGLRVRREDAEQVLAELLELAPSGVEETDLGDRVEYAIYGPPGELPELPDLRAAAGGALVEVVTTAVDDDWSERWKQFHEPITVGGRLTVRPPWRADHRPRDDEEPRPIEVVIDPGQAFGTGAHATTRLCLELLVEHADAAAGEGGADPGGALDAAPRGPVLDIGTGSGVLAIAAAKLGFGPVHACDNELEAVDAARENAAVNGVEIDVSRLDLRRVLANLLRPLLLTLAGRDDWTPPRVLIASGLLRAEADEIAQAFAARGLVERDRRISGDWAALLLDVGHHHRG